MRKIKITIDNKEVKIKEEDVDILVKIIEAFEDRK